MIILTEGEMSALLLFFLLLGFICGAVFKSNITKLVREYLSQKQLNEVTPESDLGTPAQSSLSILDHQTAEAIKEIAQRRDSTTDQVITKLLKIGFDFDAIDQNPNQRLVIRKGDFSKGIVTDEEVFWDSTCEYRNYRDFPMNLTD